MIHFGYSNSVKKQNKQLINKSSDTQLVKLPHVTKNVRPEVMIRLKPRVLNDSMSSNNESNLNFDYEILDDNTWVINGEVFHFNNVQIEDKKEDNVESIVDDLLDGYNYCIMTYGQTKTGKTKFLFSENEGFVICIYERLYAKLSKLYDENPNSSNFNITLSAYELYAESVYDLLVPEASRKPLKLYHQIDDDKTLFEFHRDEYILQDLKSVTIKDLDHLLNKFSSLRSVISGSRKSHIFIKVNIQQLNVNEDVLRNSVLQIVDLKDVELRNNTTQDDMKKIRSSLGSFKLIVDRLIHNEKVQQNFKDSTFAKLLYSLLMNNYKNLFIVCCSTLENDLTRTLDTLRFALKLSTLGTYVFHNNFGLNSKAKFDIYANEIRLREENYILHIKSLKRRLESIMEIQDKYKEFDKNIGKLELENAKLKEQIKIVKQLNDDTQKKEASDKDATVDDFVQTQDEDKSNVPKDGSKNDFDSQGTMQIILEKCEEIANLQLSLDKEKKANENYQKELDELCDMEIALRDMNIKLLDQVNSQTKLLENVLSHNETLKNEVLKWTNLVESQNKKLRRLEQELKVSNDINSDKNTKGDINKKRGQSWSFYGTKTAFWKNTKHSHIESQNPITQSIPISKLPNHVVESKSMKHGLKLNSIRVVSNPLSEISNKTVTE